MMAQALKRHGVEVIFGQAIPAALFLAAPHYGIRQIGYRTENAGAVMAVQASRSISRVLRFMAVSSALAECRAASSSLRYRRITEI